MKFAIAVLGVIATVASASAQKLDVKVVDRQEKEDAYDYAAVYNNVAVSKTFKVQGATLTLQLLMVASQLSTVKASLRNTWLVAPATGGVVGPHWCKVSKRTSTAYNVP